MSSVLCKVQGCISIDSSVCPEAFSSLKSINSYVEKGYQLGNSEGKDLKDKEDFQLFVDEGYLALYYDCYISNNRYYELTDEEAIEITKILLRDKDYILTIDECYNYKIIKASFIISDDMCKSYYKELLSGSEQDSSSLVHLLSEVEPDFKKKLKGININRIGQSEYSKISGALDQLMLYNVGDYLCLESLKFGLSFKDKMMRLVAFTDCDY